MKLALVFTIIFLVMTGQGICKMNAQKPNSQKLFAMIEPSDSGSSVTLEQANKKEVESKNKKNNFFPLYFSPLIIIIIALAVKRRKKQTTNKSKN